MAHYDPQYGYLLTAKEVSDMTGFTMNQLRNYRQRGNSPIHFLTDGNTSWYRKEDVLAYIETNGTKKLEYHTTGSYNPAPVVGTPKNQEQREHLATMAKITTENAWGSHGTWLTEQSGLPDAHNKVNEWARHFWDLYRQEIPEAEEFIPLNISRIENPSQYWKAITWAVRRATAHIKGWNDVTDREIMDIPVGEVPPSRIV
jgi:hypothetical protein